jgi:uncharacterized protein YacL (UPF0231 family)
MEYDFVHDPISGVAKASFSMEHEVIGPWLEVEVADNNEKLSLLLTTIAEIEAGRSGEIMITGHEYSVLLCGGDVTVKNNASINGAAVEIPEQLAEELEDFDQNSVGCCGIDDFRQLLLSWAKFTNN